MYMQNVVGLAWRDGGKHCHSRAGECHVRPPYGFNMSIVWTRGGYAIALCDRGASSLVMATDCRPEERLACFWKCCRGDSVRALHRPVKWGFLCFLYISFSCVNGVGFIRHRDGGRHRARQFSTRPNLLRVVTDMFHAMWIASLIDGVVGFSAGRLPRVSTATDAAERNDSGSRGTSRQALAAATAFCLPCLPLLRHQFW